MLRHLMLALLMTATAPAVVMAEKPGGNDRASVSVVTHRSSAMVQISVLNHRKIGNVTLEVRSEQGRVLYKEEGKALSNELVRRIDKGLLPKGPHTLTVVARDFAITQRFTVE